MVNSVGVYQLIWCPYQTTCANGLNVKKFPKQLKSVTSHCLLEDKHFYSVINSQDWHEIKTHNCGKKWNKYSQYLCCQLMNKHSVLCCVWGGFVFTLMRISFKSRCRIHTKSFRHTEDRNPALQKIQQIYQTVCTYSYNQPVTIKLRAHGGASYSTYLSLTNMQCLGLMLIPIFGS